MSNTSSAVGHNKPRRVLMIAQAFPPTGGSGVQRTAKFAKYLPKFGYKPLIWSAGPMPNWPLDESLLADLPADLDHRVQRCPSLRGMFSNPRGRERASFSSSGLGAASGQRELELERCGASVAGGGCKTNTSRKGSSGWKKFRTALAWRRDWIVREARLCMLPDDHLPWALASLPALRRIVRREKIDAIYSTYSPASNHLLAWFLKRYSGLPWVADFRDLWTDNFNYDEPWRMRHRARAWFETKFLEAADAVIGVSPDQTRILAGHLPKQADKFTTIPNGGDASDFADLARETVRGELDIGQEQFVFSFVGVLDSIAEPAAIIGGVAAFMHRFSEPNRRSEFRIVGVVRDSLLRYVGESGVNPTVTGYVPHERAVREMVAADVLIVGCTTTGQNCGSVVRGKVYEYMAAGRPIINVGVKGGATDKLIQGCRNCVTVPGDPQRVCATLTGMYTQWLDGKLDGGCTPQQFAPYSREALTARLSKILDRLTSTTPATAQRECIPVDPITSTQSPALV